MSEAILDGIKVVELATYIAGPASGVVLADFGADVVKIESPNRPDPFRGGHRRGSDAPLSEYPYGYIVDNRNKRAVALDIKTEAGRAAFDCLIQTADVFITNMPIPTRERLNIGYDDIRMINERIVYASISAFGEKGTGSGAPRIRLDGALGANRADGPGEARTGFAAGALVAGDGRPSDGHVAVCGDYDRPFPPGADRKRQPCLDIADGQRRLVERSFDPSHVVRRAGRLSSAARERSQPPLHNLYQTRDGRWIHIIFNTNLDRWPELAALLGRPDIGTDPRFENQAAWIENSSALIPILEAAFAERDYAEWVALLDEHRFTYGDIRKVDDIPSDPQMIEGRAIRPIDDPAAGAAYVVDSPIWVEDIKRLHPRCRRNSASIRKRSCGISVMTTRRSRH